MACKLTREAKERRRKTEERRERKHRKEAAQRREAAQREQRRLAALSPRERDREIRERIAQRIPKGTSARRKQAMIRLAMTLADYSSAEQERLLSGMRLARQMREGAPVRRRR